jgi:hypothetical protein
MSWNYRVIRTRDPATGECSYGIHEVYYDKHNKPTSYTEASIAPFGETPKELKRCLELMAFAFKKPILDFEDFSR